MTKKEEKAQAIEQLTQQIKPGDTIHCILRHVSRSGMQRVIQLVHIRPDGNAARIGYLVALALGDRYDSQREGIVVTGAGMDMGFDLVYRLGWALFPKGGDVRLSQRRHQEERDGNIVETDGGYLLRHEWL